MQNESNTSKVSQNPVLRFITEAKYRWMRHAIFLLGGLFLAFRGDIGTPNGRSKEFMDAILVTDAITYVFIMGMIYLLLLVVVPKLLFRSKLFPFFAAFTGIIVLIYIEVLLVEHFLLKDLTPPDYQRIDFSFLGFIQLASVAAVLLGSTVGLTVFKKWVVDMQRMNQLQQANLKAELEQLKSQVNPHFLFNTLNNLLVLTKTDPEKASVVLLGLSDLLRYQLYDSSKEKILLSKDIAFIQNFLSLEKIRKNDFTFSIHTAGNMDAQMLPPFLFIPFVENAVKHGASTVGHSYLDLSIEIKGKELHFYAENSKPVVKQNMPGGLGLGNIKRRLELLYPGNHSLEITDNTDKYIVNLIIPL